jgi:hypothetical protein
MSDKPLLVLLTSISPYPENRGGPSGLPWEMIEELKLAGWNVQVQIVAMPVGRVNRRLMQLAIPLGQLEVERQDADAYIAYPFYLGRLVPHALRSRTIALGPDATSMLYARFARIESGWRRWRSRFLTHWFAFQERWIADHLAGMAVVGRNDARWLRQVTGPTAYHPIYIPHPVLRNVTKPTQGKGRAAKPRLIFGGDLARKYVGGFFDTLDLDVVAQILESTNCEVIVIGKGNHAVYLAIAGRLPCQYIAWVDDYATICDPLRDVHAIPLMAGAGTKNRTLTAIAMNVIVLSTPIGTENIDPTVLGAASVHRFNSSVDFPRALSSGLAELNIRRASNKELSVPPIERITIAFKAATIRLALTPALPSSTSVRVRSTHLES